MTTSNKIIGFAGTFAAGKDTLAEHLAEEAGFIHVSTGDLVRESAMKIYGNTDRPTLLRHANELREERGGGVFVEMAIAQYPDQKLVISGIRSIGEVESLQAAGGKLVFIDADPKVRYDRAFARQRDVEATMTFEEFLESEKAELERDPSDKTEQNIAAVKQMADHVLDNNTSVEDLSSTIRVSQPHIIEV